MEQVYYTSVAGHKLSRSNARKVKGLRYVIVGIYMKFLKIVCCRAKIPFTTNIVDFDTISFNSFFFAVPVCFMRVCLYMDNIAHIKCHLSDLVKMICLIPKFLDTSIPELKILSQQVIDYLKTEDFSFLYGGGDIVLQGNGFLHDLIDFIPESFVHTISTEICNVDYNISAVRRYKYFDYITVPAAYLYRTEEYHPNHNALNNSSNRPFWMIPENVRSSPRPHFIQDSVSEGLNRFYLFYTEQITHQDAVDKVNSLKSDNLKHEFNIFKINQFLTRSKRKREEDAHKIEELKEKEAEDKEKIKCFSIEIARLNKLLVKAEEDEPKKIRKGPSCVVCIDGIANHIFLPCGHVGICEVCLENYKLKVCSICSAGNVQITKIFYASN